ncbi:MAG: hypothetical protein Q7T86_07245 [Hyphomicrobiaceae bacterium]|nr:hypothetical protein [Hyphomicrobiaceae bacterium]
MRRQLALAILLLVAAQPAKSSEYCVVCYTPDARYRCMTNDGREGQGTDQRAWLQCITQLARSGNHESCSIDKASAAPCLGVVKQIDLATMDEPRPVEPASPQQLRPQAPGQQAMPAGGEPAALPPADHSRPGGEPAAPAPANEPGLMEKSKENLEKAGGAIGDAAKKSWECMSSLFKKC